MPRDAVKFTIETHGFREAIRKLDAPEDLIGTPLGAALEEIAAFGEAVGISMAPERGGRTRRAFQKKVSKQKVPLWAVVKTTAKKNGFAYPRVVNYSPFAQNRYKKGVNVHRYWFDNAMNRARAIMERVLNKAVDEIVDRWEL